jgi:hypothetical protein
MIDDTLVGSLAEHNVCIRVRFARSTATTWSSCFATSSPTSRRLRLTARKVLTLVYDGLRDGEIRCLAGVEAAA